MPRSNLRKKYHPLFVQLSYHIKNIELVQQAFTRQSAIIELHPDAAPMNFQTLESLGDRVLNLAITQFLLTERQDVQWTPAGLHNISVVCVANQGILLHVAQMLRLERYIIRGTGEKYITSKMYADAMEALLGAIQLDASRGRVAQRIVKKFWGPYLNQMELATSSMMKIQLPFQPDSILQTEARFSPPTAAVIYFSMSDIQTIDDMLLAYKPCDCPKQFMWSESRWRPT